MSMIAFTFPGQGSQKPGMGRPWVDHESWELVAEASEITDRDVAHLLLEADAQELTATRNAQLATFVLSLVVLDAVERTGVDAARCAGHSLGEYTALTATGALSFEDGVRLVAERGEAMQVAAEERTGTMAAVLGLDDDLVDVACHSVDGDVWVANFNAPGQVVIAGDPEAIRAAGEAARGLGARKVLPVKVSGAFHTPFMGPARDRLRKALAETELRDPEVPVVANVDGRLHDRAEEWAGLLAAQLCSPVRWRQSLHTLAGGGVTTFVEIGPGTVLTGMCTRTVTSGARALSVQTPGDLDHLLEDLSGQPPVAVFPEGEHLFASERLVVSPRTGVFIPTTPVRPGGRIQAGEVVGVVGPAEVRSPFTGTLMGLMAYEGERVTASQPVAWLRTA